jgi:hypothetical protein
MYVYMAVEEDGLPNSVVALNLAPLYNHHARYTPCPLFNIGHVAAGRKQFSTSLNLAPPRSTYKQY